MKEESTAKRISSYGRGVREKAFMTQRIQLAGASSHFYYLC